MIQLIKMAQRRTWTAQEDQALKLLKDQRKIKKWSQISKILQEEFQIFGRNGKQCRQRYHNHLDDQITREKWSREENQKLMHLQIELGNRWAAISKSLPGRTDNCVKNHFYSQFRKAIRIVNDLMKKCLKKSYKAIKPNFINKIIEITQSEHRKSTMSQQFIQVAISLKEKVLMYSLGLVDQNNLQKDQKVKEIIQLLSQFNKYYRQKYTSKKIKRRSEIHQQRISSDEIKPIKIEQEQIYEEEQKPNLLYAFNTEYLSLKGIGELPEQNQNQSTQKLSEPSLIDYQQKDVQKESNSISEEFLDIYEGWFKFQI